MEQDTTATLSACRITEEVERWKLGVAIRGTSGHVRDVYGGVLVLYWAPFTDASVVAHMRATVAELREDASMIVHDEVQGDAVGTVSIEVERSRAPPEDRYQPSDDAIGECYHISREIRRWEDDVELLHNTTHIKRGGTRDTVVLRWAAHTDPYVVGHLRALAADYGVRGEVQDAYGTYVVLERTPPYVGPSACEINVWHRINEEIDRWQGDLDLLYDTPHVRYSGGGTNVVLRWNARTEQYIDRQIRGLVAGMGGDDGIRVHAEVREGDLCSIELEGPITARASQLAREHELVGRFIEGLHVWEQLALCSTAAGIPWAIIRGKSVPRAVVSSLLTVISVDAAMCVICAREAPTQRVVLRTHTKEMPGRLVRAAWQMVTAIPRGLLTWARPSR
jgi:hypothetical protein